MNLKKLFAALLVGTMALSITACSTTTAPTEDAAADASTEETTTDDPAEDAGDEAASGDALTVWCWDPAFNLYAMEEAEKVYQQENPDFALDIVEVVWDDIQTQLITSATSNQLDVLPDIFLVQNNAYQKNVINYPNLFTDLTDSGINFDEFSAGALGYSTVDGKNYGVPFDSGAAVMALRTDILAEAGYTLDDFNNITWDDFITMGTDIKEKTGKPLLANQAGSGDFIIMMLKTAGISLFDENGEPYMTENEALAKAYEKYKEMVDAGIILEFNNWDEYIGGFINGTVAGVMNGCWILASVQTAEDQAGNWGVANIPTLSGVEGSVNYSENGGSSWAISAASQNTDAAIDFLGATYGGSVEFYESILQQAGALSNWAPAGESTIYGEELDFFGGQAVYADIVDFSSQVLPFNTGVYYYEAANAIATQMVNVVNGTDIATAIADAQAETEFNME